MSPAPPDWPARVAAADWRRARDELCERGHARLPGLLRAAECRALIALWQREDVFRKHVDLARHRFGEHGAYRYFARPLPPPVEGLRRALYPRLAAVANRWQEQRGAADRYPPGLAAFLARCRRHGQERPTPLLLRYEAGGVNHLHQDLYGEVYFPLQLTVQLSEPGRDFTGGEFLLVEQRPRMQSRGEAIALRRGEGVVFATSERPVPSARGFARARMRHGVSRVHTGRRVTLGIIFHDAR